ncbi:MAG TPA: roadblock/LC7 domain-containing protein [Gaiellales bacterium]|jgi:predicted regulator of Ras-like GTPase activity (Roadblock/LC7/MglB family)|nr:roadblock/LC7 domain-containing protein [Gaiellales bacterium]
MDPSTAIRELKDLSTQIEAVVLAGTDGLPIASTLADDSAARVARLATDLVSRADGVRSDLGREALAQLQAATPDGSVFVVLESGRLAVATTGPDPTVGLVFYDLKTLLRQVANGAKQEDAADG